MTQKHRAETIAEAEAQTITLPEFQHWRAFAIQIDGYKIAEEMGLNFHDWIETQIKKYRETGSWDLTVLELRLLLFYAFRADYFTGYDYTEHDEMADSLLSAISVRTGLPYSSYDK